MRLPWAASLPAVRRVAVSVSASSTSSMTSEGQAHAVGVVLEAGAPILRQRAACRFSSGSLDEGGAGLMDVHEFQFRQFQALAGAVQVRPGRHMPGDPAGAECLAWPTWVAGSRPRPGSAQHLEGPGSGGRPPPAGAVASSNCLWQVGLPRRRSSSSMQGQVVVGQGIDVDQFHGAPAASTLAASAPTASPAAKPAWAAPACLPKGDVAHGAVQLAGGDGLGGECVRSRAVSMRVWTTGDQASEISHWVAALRCLGWGRRSWTGGPGS